MRNAENFEARIYLTAVLGQLCNQEAAAWQVYEIRAIEPNVDVQRWLVSYPMTGTQQKQRLMQALRTFGL